MIQPPIAYIIFNRPQHTEKSFAGIREQRPRKLFIIADGPRADHPTDAERCRAVREIVENVYWPCDVYRNYADANLGLKHRVSSGLDWVFENVERAIILEDDCVAHPDFFTFCEELLDRYSEDERVSVITGNNFQHGHRRGEASYYFSKYNHCWGWATWRRAWQFYEGDMPFWPEWKKTLDWRQKIADPQERKYWSTIFDKVKADEIDTWDYPWTACVWRKGGLTATPNVNLVSNIGFGEDATHTTSPQSQHSEMQIFPLGELTHPGDVQRNNAADTFVFQKNFHGADTGFLQVFLAFPKRVAKYIFHRLSIHLSSNVRS